MCTVISGDVISGIVLWERTGLTTVLSVGNHRDTVVRGAAIVYVYLSLSCPPD